MEAEDATGAIHVCVTDVPDGRRFARVFGGSETGARATISTAGRASAGNHDGSANDARARHDGTWRHDARDDGTGDLRAGGKARSTDDGPWRHDAHDVNDAVWVPLHDAVWNGD